MLRVVEYCHEKVIWFHPMETSVKAIPNYLLCKPLFRVVTGWTDVIDIMPLIRAYLHFGFGNP